MAVLVGGVGQLYQGDFDLGRLAVERLAGEDLGADVLVEDFHYGAVAVAQRLEDLRPTSVIFVGAEERGRAPGTVERRRVRPLKLSAADVQRSVGDAVTGYVTMDLAIEVASGFGALPERAIAVEVEPARKDASEQLSPEAQAALEESLELVRAEVRRAPLLQLADELRALLAEERLERSEALDAVRDTLRELEILDEEGRWGATFALKDRLRLKIAQGKTGEGMSHLDWGLWWALIEELDRQQSLESALT